MRLILFFVLFLFNLYLTRKKIPLRLLISFSRESWPRQRHRSQQFST